MDDLEDDLAEPISLNLDILEILAILAKGLNASIEELKKLTFSELESHINVLKRVLEKQEEAREAAKEEAEMNRRRR